MTSIKKSIKQLKEEDINKGFGSLKLPFKSSESETFGKYELYNEYNDKILMDSLYVKNNIENYDNYEKIFNNKLRKIPDKQICNIENEYKCKNMIKEFDKLKNKNNNDIEHINNKYDKEIKNNSKDNNKKYNELKKDIKMIRYFNIFLCLLISLLIIILLTYKIL